MTSNDIPPAYSGPPSDAESDKQRFRRTLIRVLTLQVIAIIILGLLQPIFRP